MAYINTIILLRTMYNDKGCTTILVLLLVFIIHQSEEQIHVPEWKMSRARKFWNITYEDYSYHEEQRAFNGNEIYPFPEGSMFSVSFTCWVSPGTRYHRTSDSRHGTFSCICFIRAQSTVRWLRRTAS